MVVKNYREGTILYRVDTQALSVVVTLQKAIAYLRGKSVPEATITGLLKRKLPGTIILYLPGGELQQNSMSIVPFNFISESLTGYSPVPKESLQQRKGLPLRKLAEIDTLERFLEFLEHYPQ